MLHEVPRTELATLRIVTEDSRKPEVVYLLPFSSAEIVKLLFFRLLYAWNFLSVFIFGDLSDDLKAILDKSTLCDESQHFMPSMFLFEYQTYCFIQVHFVPLAHHSHLDIMRD